MEIDESKSTKPLTPSSVYRLGRVIHMKADAFARTFDQPIQNLWLCFVDTDVINKLIELSKQSETKE